MWVKGLSKRKEDTFDFLMVYLIDLTLFFFQTLEF